MFRGGCWNSLTADMTFAVGVDTLCCICCVYISAPLAVLSSSVGYAFVIVHHQVKTTAVLVTRNHALPSMQEAETTGKARPRSIVNISSTTGTHGNSGQANYATAKAGVVGLTKTIAKEWCVCADLQLILLQ